ncbi:MAG: apolipoprotein N-acyltransferase, partial [bacterium]|nr:apolipoprotein N-acyltransferase [bacterium]
AVQSLQSNVDLIIWPEAAWTGTLWLWEKGIAPEEIGLSSTRVGKPFSLVGLTFTGIKEKRQRFFNSAALFDASGNMLDKYHKSHLVPFGEYVPLEKMFSFIKPVAAIGDFEAGEKIEPIKLQNISLAPLICFEDIFPEISRIMTRKGASLLVNMTNDAWYGISSAPYQHLTYSVLRAVENRRSLVRATNTGVTAVIDPTGKVVVASPIFEQGVLVHQVPLMTERTLYTKVGDWFIWACLIFVIWEFFKSCRKKSKNGSTPAKRP